MKKRIVYALVVVVILIAGGTAALLRGESPAYDFRFDKVSVREASLREESGP